MSKGTMSTLLLGLLCLVVSTAPAQAGTKHYYYTDAQGTVLAKADAQGSIVASYDYAPYGKQVLGTPPSGPSGYTGHVNDAESGFVYMQARYYDPGTGRFLSVDPVTPSAGNLYSFNRYVYASNNPIMNIDPDGRQSTGETIDRKTQQAFNETGGGARAAAWVFAGVAWKALGAEGLSQVVDKGSSASTGDKVGAGIEVLSAFPPIKIAGKIAIVAEDVAKGVDAAKAGTKFSSEKAALVDMAKSDKRAGMTSGDMQAYKDLNKELPDPFPTNKVRGPEAHDSGAPTSQQPHGHVGPVDHIPINDQKP